MPNMTVSQFLATLPKDETIYYRANPGNAGDALIACGAFKLFNDAKLKIQIIDLDNFDATGKIVFYAGGGNLVGIYPEARDFFIKYHETAKLLVLLPHTVAENEDLLSMLGDNVILFARENVTYEHLKRNTSKAKVFLDHDLALHIDANEIINTSIRGIVPTIALKLLYKISKSPEFARLPQPAIMWRNTQFELSSLLKGDYNIGNFFREDVEKALDEAPEGNMDHSKIYEYGTRNDAITNYTTVRLMKYVNHFKKIRTDRLHICIAAGLLGKDVEFYPNSYFKCKAVYEFSLKNKLKTIKWMAKE